MGMKSKQASWYSRIAHRDYWGQEPCSQHCQRVAAKVAEQGYPDYVVAVAYLHEVLAEADGLLLHDFLVNRIMKRLSAPQREALDAITRRDDESNRDYIERVGNNGIARAIKIAGLNDWIEEDADEKQRYGREVSLLRA